MIADVRAAVALAILHLAPRGDLQAAAAVEAVVEADEKRGDARVLQGDDMLVKVALALRARAGN